MKEVTQKILIKKLEVFSQALDTLGEALTLKKKRIHMDGTIQRFEYCFELAWKLLQSYGRYKGNADLYGSRDSIREGHRLGVIQNVEDWMGFLKARNITSHTYDESIANVVYKTAHDFYKEATKLKTNLQTEFANL